MLSEQRDSGDAGRARFLALRRMFRRHSAQGIDRQLPHGRKSGDLPHKWGFKPLRCPPFVHPRDAAFPFPERDEDAEPC